MYEALTQFLDTMNEGASGEWVTDEKNKDGSISFPFVNYEGWVRQFTGVLSEFVMEHPTMRLTGYQEILEENNIDFDGEHMDEATLLRLDDRAIMACLVAAMRAEKFCDGIFLRTIKNGNIRKWLMRLKTFDAQ